MQNQSDSHHTGQVADECGLRSAACRSHAQVMGDVKADFNISDEYRAWFRSVGRSTNLCPAPVWRLRNSATGYRRLLAAGGGRKGKLTCSIDR
jgi:uncharacterized protein YfaT (DUF1175 family)